MPRSRRRSRSTASQAAAPPSPSSTCWGNCTWPTQATAGACADQPSAGRKGLLSVGIKLAWPPFLRLQGYHHQEQRDHSHVDRVHARIRTTAAPVPGTKTLHLLTHQAHEHPQAPFTWAPVYLIYSTKAMICWPELHTVHSHNKQRNQQVISRPSSSRRALQHLSKLPSIIIITWIDQFVLWTFCASSWIHEWAFWINRSHWEPRCCPYTCLRCVQWPTIWPGQHYEFDLIISLQVCQ